MTQMVNEFPDMQGIMGRYQAIRDGECEELAQAMEEFYLPRFSGDRLPQSKTGIAISLAEKLDTLVGIFGIGMKPTGDKDPFALRRTALGALRIMREHALPVSLTQLLERAASIQNELSDEADVVNQVYNFMIERLKGIYHDEGIPVDIFDAVAVIKPETTADFDRRVNAVVAFRNLPEASSLAAANKRIRNILKKAGDKLPESVDHSLFEHDEERDLFAQIGSKREQVLPLLQNFDYEAALISLAELKNPVDSFFDEVMVMADDPSIRANRLALLTEMSDLFLGVADISKLQVSSQ